MKKITLLVVAVLLLGGYGYVLPQAEAMGLSIPLALFPAGCFLLGIRTPADKTWNTLWNESAAMYAFGFLLFFGGVYVLAQGGLVFQLPAMLIMGYGIVSFLRAIQLPQT